MACSVARSQPYRGIVGRLGGRATGLGEVSDPEALEAAVEAAWDSITKEWLEELIRSMPA